MSRFNIYVYRCYYIHIKVCSEPPGSRCKQLMVSKLYIAEFFPSSSIFSFRYPTQHIMRLMKPPAHSEKCHSRNSKGTALSLYTCASRKAWGHRSGQMPKTEHKHMTSEYAIYYGKVTGTVGYFPSMVSVELMFQKSICFS